MNKTSTKYILFQPRAIPMYINHVHRYHIICHKISSMECINHMPLPTCQPCASTEKCLNPHFRVSTMHLRKYFNTQPYITNTNYVCQHVIMKTYKKPCQTLQHRVIPSYHVVTHMHSPFPKAFYHRYSACCTDISRMYATYS
jgi:hypothetical protein